MRPRPAFTLIELMVVVTLIAVAMGMATVGLREVSETARVRSTIDQFRAFVRAAHVHASFTGRPVMMECKADGFRLRKPVQVEHRWRWHDSTWMQLDERLRVESVHVMGVAPSSPLGDKNWASVVRPGDWLGRYELTVGFGTGAAATAVVPAFGSMSDILWRREKAE